MTQKGKSRNVLASPLGEEGHEVAKGWTVVILIMILDVDVTAAGGIIKPIARKGDTTTLGPKGRCPLSEANTTLLYNLRRSRAPFFIICGGAATTTLGAKGPVKLKNPPAHRAGQS